MTIDDLGIIIKNEFDGVNKKFESVDKRFDGVNNQLKELKQGQKNIELKLCRLSF